ncbi:MAG TPA: hypothetical protein VL179_12730 [Mycobacterium sp.]|nr:hypothetical protein [Mycobacterium sp.]
MQRIDALMNATDVKVLDVAAVADTHRGARGLRQLDATLQLVDGGADSPYESLTRLLLVQAGFPRPQTQIRVYDSYGRVVARVDLGWREYLVATQARLDRHQADQPQAAQQSGSVPGPGRCGLDQPWLPENLVTSAPSVRFSRLKCFFIN